MVKIRIDKRLIELKDLVRICIRHYQNCDYFNKLVKECSVPENG